jgi:hypothetical protein
MKPASLLQRTSAAIGGGILAGITTGILFALRTHEHRLDLAWRQGALLSLPGLFIGALLAVLVAPMTSERAARVREIFSTRSKIVGSLWVVVPVACAVWVGLTSFAARHFMTAYHHVGLAAFAQSIAFLIVTLGVVAASGISVRWVARRVPENVDSWRGVLTFPAVGIGLAFAIIGHGVYHGDIHGKGRAIALLMGGYGVLKKPELDLTPVAMLATMAALACALTWTLRRVGLIAMITATVLCWAALHHSSTLW